MSDLRVKLLLELVDRLTQPVGRLTSRISAFSVKMSESFRRVGESVVALGSKITSVGKKLSLTLTTSLSALGFASLKTAGDIETLNIKFESLLQSSDMAKQTVSSLIDFTARTPFQLQGVSDAAVKLLTAGVEAENLTDRLGVLGDVAALAGADMSELGTIYSRVKSQQVAYTMELEMLSDRGVPIWQELSKITGKSIRRIRKETANGLVTFKLFEEALESMRREGGVAFQQMEKQSRSWDGLLSTLRDNIKLAFAEIGETAIESLDLKKFISDLIVGVQSLVATFQKLPEPVQGFIIKGGLVLALLGPMLMAFGQLTIGLGLSLIGISKLAGGMILLASFTFKTLIPALWAVTLAIARMGIALLATPIGWILLGIVALAGAVYLIIKNWKKVSGFFKNLWDGIKEIFVNSINFIMDALKPLLKTMEFLSNPAVNIGKLAGEKIAKALNKNSSPFAQEVNKVSGYVANDGESSKTTAVNNQLSGKIEIKVDAEGRSKVHAAMDNRDIDTVVDQGIVMGGAL